MIRAALLAPIIIFAALFSMAVFQPVGAVDVIDPSICDGGGDQPAICTTNSNYTNQTATNNVLVGPDGMITRTTQTLVWASGALAILLIIIAGFMFVFSSGNPESVGRARRTVLYAVIGMIIAVLGQIIVSFVLERL